MSGLNWERARRRDASAPERRDPQVSKWLASGKQLGYLKSLREEAGESTENLPASSLTAHHEIERLLKKLGRKGLIEKTPSGKTPKRTAPLPDSPKGKPRHRRRRPRKSH